MCVRVLALCVGPVQGDMCVWQRALPVSGDSCVLIGQLTGNWGSATNKNRAPDPNYISKTYKTRLPVEMEIGDQMR